MKKITFFLMIIFISGIISCKNIKGRFGNNDEKIKELTAYNEALKKMIREDSVMHLQELNMLREQYEREIAELKKSPVLQQNVKGYFVVVGSFKKALNAENYSKEIKLKGYEGAIIEGPNNFSLVTSGTFTNLGDAVKGYNVALNEIIPTAWIYVKR